LNKEVEFSIYPLSGGYKISPGTLVRRMGYSEKKGAAVGLVVWCDTTGLDTTYNVIWSKGER